MSISNCTHRDHDAYLIKTCPQNYCEKGVVKKIYISNLKWESWSVVQNRSWGIFQVPLKTLVDLKTNWINHEEFNIKRSYVIYSKWEKGNKRYCFGVSANMKPVHFPDLEQRLQPGGVQQAVENLRSIDVLIYRLPHLLDHICQDLTQACDTQTHRHTHRDCYLGVWKEKSHE